VGFKVFETPPEASVLKSGILQTDFSDPQPNPHEKSKESDMARPQLHYTHPHIINKLRGLHAAAKDIYHELAYLTNGGKKPYHIKEAEFLELTGLSKSTLKRNLRVLAEQGILDVVSKRCYNIAYKLAYEVAALRNDGESYVGAKIMWWFDDSLAEDVDETTTEDRVVHCRIYYEGKQSAVFPVLYDKFLEYRDHYSYGFIQESPLRDDVKQRLASYSSEVIPATTPKLEDPNHQTRHKIKADRTPPKKPSTPQKSGISSPEKQPNTGNSKQREKSSKPQTKPQASNIPRAASLPDDYESSPMSSFYDKIKQSRRSK
jgi:DNA-binding transcriptional ArsR family regulator